LKRLSLPQLQKRINNLDTLYVVNFWATSCKPGIEELPYFEKLQATYKNQPLKVLLVSMDFESKLPAVKTFARTHQLASEVFWLSVAVTTGSLMASLPSSRPLSVVLNGKIALNV
jgi:thiol-disulfide isomerase/thioredoxin